MAGSRAAPWSSFASPIALGSKPCNHDSDALVKGEIILRCYTGVALTGRLFLFWTTGLDGNEATNRPRLWKANWPPSSRHAWNRWASNSCGSSCLAANGPRFRSWPTARMARRSPSRIASRSATMSAPRSMSMTQSRAPGRWRSVLPASIVRLTRVKDWNRFAGHLARVETFFPQNGRKRFSGIVLGADENAARTSPGRRPGSRDSPPRHPPGEACIDGCADRRHRAPGRWPTEPNRLNDADAQRTL